jgi:arsenate reductase-like glutaredoxin family protein
MLLKFDVVCLSCVKFGSFLLSDEVLVNITKKMTTHAILFKNIDEQSHQHLLQQLQMNAITDYIVLNPALIASFYQIELSAYRALLPHELKCRSLNSEFIYYSSPCKHVKDALKYHNIENTRNVLIVFLNTTLSEEEQLNLLNIKANNIVRNEQIDNELKQLRDLDQIYKLYKLTPQEKQSVNQLEQHILSRLAIKEL